MTTDKRMQDKIRKLLALASDPGAAPNEAETAGRMAAKLMAAHDISLDSLTEAELKAQWDLTSTVAQGCRPGKKNAKEVPTWIGIISWGVKVYTRTRVKAQCGQVIFSGPREDTELAKWLHELLLEGCYKGSNGLGMRDANQYRNGYAAALQSRLKAMAKTRDTSDTEDATGTALVRVHTARTVAMNEAFGDENSGKKSQVSQSEAERGVPCCAPIPMGRPIGSNGQRMLSC